MVLERFIGHNEAAATDFAMAKDSPQRGSGGSRTAAQQAAAQVAFCLGPWHPYKAVAFLHVTLLSLHASADTCDR